MEIGRYRIVRRLGQGGMAEVFEAVAVGEGGFQRRVALKRILPHHVADPSFARMFLDEARIASRLHHANVVSVLDVGVVDGQPFQVLEFVDGISALQLLQRCAQRARSVPVEVALHIATQVAHGLHHAHGARDHDGEPLGVVHRDVTPANILLAWSGDVRLVDFGVAFAVRRAEATQTGMTKGSLLYMAPEQATAGSLDARTDVFSLGCVLHALCVGYSPMTGDDRLLKLVMGTALPIDPGVPPDVAAIVARALAGSREKRFASAAEMAEAMGVALARRVDRDPRALLGELLAEIREEPGPATTGKRRAAGVLDELLAVELVLERRDGADGERHFTSSSTALHGPTRERVAAVVPASGGAKTTALSTASRRVLRRGRTGWIAAGVLAILVVGLLGIVFLRPTRPDVAAAPPRPAAAPPIGAPAVRVAPDAGPRVVAIAPAPDAGVPPTPRAPGRDGPRGARAGGRRPPPTEPPATGTGYLLIAGAGAINLEIVVDGRRRGTAPKQLALPAGRHRVALIGRDGSTVARRDIELTVRNTPSRPLTWSRDR